MGLRELFDEIVELAPDARARWLAENVDDAGLREALAELLAADARESVLDISADELGARIGPADAVGDALSGQEIGGFRLVRMLGQGGMATVFLGERLDRDFTQRAAIKLLRRGLYSALEERLFQRERRVLASLDHPHVARLIDGGVTAAGIPYLVLEYVDGVPITAYARAQGLDLRARLALFLDVCSAVEAAHRALIIHRDIKPANILVTGQGEVKLLDFGIAKLLEEGTDATATTGLFTRHYAAPEQLRGELATTATDVHGLGLLLRELLLGFSPQADAEIDSAPRAPSSLAHEGAPGGEPKRDAAGAAMLRRHLRGDLDNIVLKALDAAPTRRYASAQALAEDITRYLEGRPVLAHPPTRWYRTKKFVQRHRGGVTVTAVLVLAVFASLGIAIWQAGVARREARAARIESAKAEQVADFAAGMLASVDPNRAKTMDRSLMRLVLGAGARNAEQKLAAQPVVRAQIEEIIGSSYASISDFASADTHFAMAERSAAEAGLDLATRVRTATQRAIALFSLGDRKDDARAQDLRAVELAATLPADDRERLLAESSALSHECARRPQSDCSERHARIMDPARRALAADDPYLLRILRGQMVADIASRRDEQAGALYRELAQRNRDRYGSEDSRTLQAVRNLANFDDHHGDAAEAEQLLRENLPVARRWLGDDNALTAEMTFELGSSLAKQGRHAEARPLLMQSVDLLTAVLGARALATTTADLVLIENLVALGELDEAEQRARVRLAAQQETTGHGDHGIFRMQLARVLIARKNYADAERELDETRVAAGDATAEIAAAYVDLYTAWNKPRQADIWRARAAAGSSRSEP